MERLHCQRCSRDGHNFWKCKETKDVWGTSIILIEFSQSVKKDCNIL